MFNKKYASMRFGLVFFRLVPSKPDPIFQHRKPRGKNFNTNKRRGKTALFSSLPSLPSAENSLRRAAETTIVGPYPLEKHETT
jgi:hypothetical protein